MLETKAIDMGFLELTLRYSLIYLKIYNYIIYILLLLFYRLVLDENNIFNIHDSFWGLDYFAVTIELFSYWV